jgi:hypothetical protein
MIWDLPVLQLGDLILDTVPEWVAPILVILGIEIIIGRKIVLAIGNLQKTRQVQITNREQRAIIGGLTLGILFSALAVIQKVQISNEYAILLLFCGRAIEGAAAIRFYKKIIVFLRDGKYSGSIVSKVKHKLTILFILSITIFVFIYILIDGPIFNSIGYSVQFLWMISVLSITTLSLRWKLRPVWGIVDRKSLIGVLFFVGGAEIFNHSFLGEVVALIAGAIGYTLGFWFTAALLVRDQKEPIAMKFKNIIRTVRISLR